MMYVVHSKINKNGLRHYIYTLKKETQLVKKYNLLQIFNIILNTEISITFTLKFGTLVVQMLKFIKMSRLITLMCIAFR
jgi:hypothetical protein